MEGTDRTGRGVTVRAMANVAKMNAKGMLLPMMLPPKPENENHRLRVLRKLDLLDTAPEERFDRISAIAQKLFDVPIVLVTLVDGERQWFKSNRGLEVQETARDISFCGHAILGDELFEVEDALEDLRFADNPLVTGHPGIRFYAGVPVAALDGSKLGTLCLIDSRPRQLSDDQRRMLIDLALLVEAQLNHAEALQLASGLNHAEVEAGVTQRARLGIRQVVEESLRPMLDGVRETLEELVNAELGSARGEQQLLIRQALIKLQGVSDDIEAFLNPDALSELVGSPQASTPEDFYKEFLAAGNSCAEQIQTAGTGEDLSEFVRLVSKLTTFANAIGATNLAEYCSDMESVAREQDRMALDQRIKRFPQVYAEVCEWVERQIGAGRIEIQPFDPKGFTNSILIVDDESFVLKVTAHALENMGFTHVVTAETGQQALDLLRTTTPDVRLALVDLNMPDMDGIELLRRFDEVSYSGDILLFSGEDSQTLSMAESLANARNLSVLGSVGKPVQRDRLLELLARRTQPSSRPARSVTAPHISAAMLEAAIDAGELEPWFQPKIDVLSRQPVGVEMLARWPNGPTGPVYPDEFIPVAESSGLIDRMTFMLIGKAIAIEREWRAQGVRLKVAVNLSMQSLQATDFSQQLEQVVEKAGGDLSSLQLEVTESSLMEDLIAPLDVLLRLRLKKVRLSIDDFGTGHSNLSQLRDLPFDELKLDRSYIRGEGQRARTILESSVDIAKKMGMSIVAEGVETLDDWRRVEKLGCDQAQGWLCAKAMPGDAIPAWMESWEETCRQLFNDDRQS